MKNKILSLESRTGQNLAVASIALALLLLMPLIGALLFMARFVAAGLLALGLAVGIIAYLTSSRFRALLEDQGDLEYNGLHLAPSVALHRGHAWVRTGGKKVVVGADDLSLAALGPVEGCELPRVGDHVRQGDDLLRLRHGRRYLRLRSPISGEVVATHDELVDRPAIANQDPYGNGWLVGIRPDPDSQDGEGLFRGKEARSWFRHEVDRFLALVMPSPMTGEALPDGGELVGDLHRLLDDVTWNRLHDLLFA